MRGCGTVFHPNQLTGEDIEQIRDIERLAGKYEITARLLRNAVLKCEEEQTTKGLSEMVALAFNAQLHQPQYGGGGGGLPPGKYKGVIVNSSKEDVVKNGQVVGGYLALDLTPIDGPLKDQKHTDRLNLMHTNPTTVEIANKQLSAYCHVTGVFQFEDTAQLHGKPFLFEIGYQKGQEPTQEKPNGGYTEVKEIRDLAGNLPGKAPAGGGGQAGPAPSAPEQPAGGVQAQGGGWGGAGADAGAGAGAGGQQSGWGGAGQGGGQQQQGGGQPQGGGGWGNAGGGQAQGGDTGGGQAGGWNQAGGGQAAPPGWGPR